MLRTSVAISLLVFLHASTAFGQDKLAGAYPEKPVRLIIPYAAGGPTDDFSRVIRQEIVMWKKLAKEANLPLINP